MANIRLPEENDFKGMNIDKIGFVNTSFSRRTGSGSSGFSISGMYEDGDLLIYEIVPKIKDYLYKLEEVSVFYKLKLKNNDFYGVLPVIEFDDFVKEHAKLVNDRLGIYEFGRYMNDYADYGNQLDAKLEKNELKETGRTYTINDVEGFWGSYKMKFKPLVLKEYEDKGFYYVKVNGNWYTVEPVKWCLNKRKKCLVSTRILLSCIPYVLEGTKEKRYETSFVKEFLEKYLYRDLTQGLSNKRDEETKKENVNEIQGLVDEIKKYSEYCFDKDSVFAKVNEYIATYKTEISNLKNDKSGLVLKDEKAIYLELINNLSNLLNKLKKYHADNLIYFDIIDIINNCLSILQGDVVISSNNELEKDMKVIHDVVVPFLGNNVVFEELRNLFVNEKNGIMDYLNKKVNIAGLSLEDNKELYTSSYDFEIKMREKLMPLLTSMNDKVNQKDLVDEVNKSIEGSLANIPIKTKNRIAKVYMNAINGEVIKINRLSGSELYQNELKDILDFKVDYENSTDEIISILQKVLISLYKLEDKIAKENIRNSSLENYEEVGNIKL